MTPGELLTEPGDHPLNPGRRTHAVVVQNSGGRPIQVGSHYRFAQTNGALQFDRAAAHGMRLNIASGAAMGLEAGPQCTVERVECAGAREVWGFRALIRGKPWHGNHLGAGLRRDGPPHRGRPAAPGPHRADHRGQGPPHAACRRLQRRVKFDGIERHRSVAIGRAGNPDVQPGVDTVTGTDTETQSFDGLIVTAGGIDSHIPLICPQQIDEALYSGVHHQVGRRRRPGHLKPGRHWHARP